MQGTLRFKLANHIHLQKSESSLKCINPHPQNKPQPPLIHTPSLLITRTFPSVSILPLNYSHLLYLLPGYEWHVGTADLTIETSSPCKSVPRLLP